MSGGIVDDFGPIAAEIEQELGRAQMKFAPLHSGHEAQSVIAEEFHELSLAIWFGVDQHGQAADPRTEAIQLAAMAIRFILDVVAPVSVEVMK